MRKVVTQTSSEIKNIHNINLKLVYMTPKQIRRELAILRNKLITQSVNPNKALNDARQAMNLKYGHTWRNEDYTVKQNCGSISPSVHDEHIFGEHWQD